jgi:hypothetical protein
MRYLVPIFALALMGCIHAPTAGSLAVTPGVPSPTQAQIDACEKTRTWHNVWTIMGTVSGALSGAGGGAETIVQDNKTAVTGIAIGSAAFGVLATVAATAAGMEADAYSTANCQTVLSQAPAAP